MKLYSASFVCKKDDWSFYNANTTVLDVDRFELDDEFRFAL